MIKFPRKMYFNSDEEFYKFCVVPVCYEKPLEPGQTCRCFDFSLSDAYNNAVKNNIIFIIKDPNSQIYKRQAVSYRTITKPIKNLQEYFEI